MIKQEQITINNKNFIKTYSDENKYILQVETNLKYIEAIDIMPLKYTYTEISENVEVNDNNAKQRITQLYEKIRFQKL